MIDYSESDQDSEIQAADNAGRRAAAATAAGDRLHASAGENSSEGDGDAAICEAAWCVRLAASSSSSRPSGALGGAGIRTDLGSTAVAAIERPRPGRPVDVFCYYMKL